MSDMRKNLVVLAVCLVSPSVLLWSAQDRKPNGDPNTRACNVLGDKRLEEPLSTIAREYGLRTGSQIALHFLSASEVDALVKKMEGRFDIVFCMPETMNGETEVEHLPDALKVAWKYPSGEPVWAATLTKLLEAPAFVRFAGGPTGHRLWSESKSGFTIVSDASANAHEWVAEHRTKHTYPMTAMRMLAECGGIRDGTCIDVGCGPGHLDVELAKRSNFEIIGLDINPGAKPLFEKRIRKAGLEGRVSFVVGDAQRMPFPDDYADVVFSRGTLIFIPNIERCLQETYRILKPTGVAFLGGRYIYTPQVHKISTEKLKEIVRKSGVPGAQVIDARGQWVKIIGPQAPEAAHHFQGGPHMLANRLIADYGITEGKCLLICGSDGSLQQALQQGLVEITNLNIVALYSSEKVVSQAKERIRDVKLADRINCKVGKIQALPFEESSFDLIAGVGPLLIREKSKQIAMRELYRVLGPGGAALVGGRYLGMPASFRVSSESLRKAAADSGIPWVRVYDDMGQWVEIRKEGKD